MPLPVATMGAKHLCPMVTGTVPHVGGPVVKGNPRLIITGLPVATMGSICTCVGPPDKVVKGNPKLLVGVLPVATMGSSTLHGGKIVVGNPRLIT